MLFIFIALLLSLLTFSNPPREFLHPRYPPWMSWGQKLLIVFSRNTYLYAWSRRLWRLVSFQISTSRQRHIRVSLAASQVSLIQSSVVETSLNSRSVRRRIWLLTFRRDDLSVIGTVRVKGQCVQVVDTFKDILASFSVLRGGVARMQKLRTALLRIQS